MSAPPRPRPLAPENDAVLVTGGAGFVGANLVHRLASLGLPVIVLDNLSRPGVERNVEWLSSLHPSLVRFERGDVRDPSLMNRLARQVSRIYHFAAQVAVTTSLDDPLSDFEVNARGTLNVLEAARLASRGPAVLFTSTNKVYGDLGDVELISEDGRYQPRSEIIAKTGISEARPISFHSPYGCSKGAADQYVLDYARCFRVPTVVFRMSCIYGPRQFGTEDQGWVAHFLIRALEHERIVLYGDGRQVRDILFVDDLLDAMLLASSDMEALAGSAFNIGGGPANSISLLEVLEMIESTLGREVAVEHGPWRTGDQRYYVSDTRRFQASTGWSPRISPAEGIARLAEWMIDEHSRRELPAIGGRPDAARPRTESPREVRLG